MRCDRCHAANPDDSRICRRCGATLATRCHHCGFAAQPGSRFCGGCGRLLTPGMPLPGEAEPPGASTGGVRGPATALDGERKHVTVMFADIKGSLAVIIDLDAEQARGVLDAAVGTMMEPVRRYGGTVNQTLGDGIMALFGAPLSQEDHAVRACYAAIAMQEAFRTIRFGSEWGYAIQLGLRIGLHSGEVVARAVRNDFTIDYTAVGQTTHLASRLEQLAVPGTIRLTAETARLAEGFIQTELLGAVPIKGMRDVVRVFELKGATLPRTRFQATVTRGLARFVGREAELAALKHALAEAGSGRGRVLAVAGEAGVGKSRLLYEFARSPEARGWLTLESGSVSYGKVTPWLPVVHLLKSYFQIEDGDDHARKREKVVERLRTRDLPTEGMLTPLLILLDVPVEDPEWDRLEPDRRRRRIQEAAADLLLEESKVQPLIIVFEDLHTADSETAAFLDGLVDRIAAARILLLVSYRPAFEHAWEGRSHFVRCPVDPLPDDTARRLLETLVGHDPDLEPLKQLLIRRTEGNPFFIEEGVRTLVETGALAGERGAYRLVKPLPALDVPATVQAMIAARIDRLDDDDKGLLLAAAVIGKTVDFGLLRAISDESEDRLRAALARLGAADFLHEARLYPKVEYAFKHALTHEVAYGSLLQDQRRRLHVRIVEAITDGPNGGNGERVQRLAYHSFQGQLWEKALAYYRDLGARAMSRSANAEAVAAFERALTALDALPGTADFLEQSIDVKLDAASALFGLGEQDRALARIQEAQDLAQKLDDQRRLARVFSAMTLSYWTAGDLIQAIESGRRARVIAEQLDDFDLRVQTTVRLALMHQAHGEYRRTIEPFSWVLRSLDGDLIRERFGLAAVASVVCRTSLARSMAELGRFAEATATAQEGIHLAEAIEHPFSRIYAYREVGLFYTRQGEFTKSIALLERGRQLCSDANVVVLAPASLATLGYAYILSGRVAEGFALLRQAVESVHPRALVVRRSLHLAWLAEACLLADRIGEAMEHAECALHLSRTCHERGHEAWTLRLLAELHAHPGASNPEMAATYFDQAIAHAEELEMRVLLAHCHRGLGLFDRRGGRPGQARKRLARAAGLYRAAGMPYWLRQTELAMDQCL